MNLIIELYSNQIKEWPQNGHHIMAQYVEDKVIVYQSYHPEIGKFAAEHKFFGGAFKLTRMTWIKPNFLWMMYRNGWGTKVGQEIVLAISLKRTAFERYLDAAVCSAYQEEIYKTKENWQAQVKNSNVRLQWDPDHDPYGEKVERRAIQLGIRGEQIRKYAKEDILDIQDISQFVRKQHKNVLNKELDKLLVPSERKYIPKNEETAKRLRIEK